MLAAAACNCSKGVAAWTWLLHADLPEAPIVQQVDLNQAEQVAEHRTQE